MTRAVHPAFSAAVRAAAVLATAVALVWLFDRAVLPDGRLVATTDLTHPAAYVSEPKPSERLADPATGPDGAPMRQVIGDQVYLDVTPPSAFDDVAMTVRYANVDQPMLELGAMASSIDEQYEMQAADAALIDALPWRRVSSGAFSLWQRDGNYASVDEFLRNPPDRKTVAAYHADVSGLPFTIPGYAPATDPRTIVMSLRGSHRILTYVGKGEPLSYSFTVQDMNRQDGADPTIVSVYREAGGEPVARAILDDDGDATDDQRSSKLRTVSVSVADPAEGVYKIEFTSSADVFIREIRTRQRKMVFADHVYLGDHVGYSDKTPPATVWTNGRRIVARTAHPESLQTVKVGAKANVVIAQPSVRYVQDVAEPGTVPIVSPKRDVLLESDGLFALSPDDWFDPAPYPVRWYTTKDDLDRAGVKYVLANYEPPATDGPMRVAVATFSAKDLARTKDGAWRFVIAAPGIGDTHHDLRVESVSFAMRREPVTWSNAFGRLMAIFAPRGEQVLRVVSDGVSYGESLP
jgi:hypothetical protein